MKHVRIVLLLAAGAVLAGCGKGDGDDMSLPVDLSQPQETVRVLLSAINRGDYNAFRYCFTKLARETIVQDDLARLRSQLERDNPFAGAIDWDGASRGEDAGVETLSLTIGLADAKKRVRSYALVFRRVAPQKWQIAQKFW